MIIGLDFFQGNCFDGNICAGSINQIDIENIKIDEIKIDTGTDTIYDINKQNWDYDTILQDKFQDLNFEAGNVSLLGMPIDFLRVKKRKTDELIWNTYKDISFNPSATEYNWSDFFVESLTDYDYCVVPVGSQNIEGDYSIKDINCNYEDIWIFGSNNEQYRLMANIQKGDVTTVSPSSFIETLGSKYPYEISNGSISYRKGNLKAVVVSDSTLNGNNGIDRVAEKTLRNSLYKFLINKKPKLYKDAEGDYILVSIKADSVKMTPMNELSRQICEISFDFYEIGDCDSTNDLTTNGLL